MSQAPAIVAAASPITDEQLSRGLAVALVRQAYPLRPVDPATGSEVPFALQATPAGWSHAWERSRQLIDAGILSVDYLRGLGLVGGAA